MKKILFLTLITLISFAGFSQSDAYLNVVYKGYLNGQYIIQVDSKDIGCNPDIFISYGNITPTAISPNPKNEIHNNKIIGTSTTFYITAPLVPNPIFTFTDLSICNWKGSSPLAIVVDMNPTLLPLTFERIPIVKPAQQGYVIVTFIVGDQSQVKVYNVQLSKDNGATWKNYAIVLPDNTTIGKTYSVNVKLNQ